MIKVPLFINQKTDSLQIAKICQVFDFKIVCIAHSLRFDTVEIDLWAPRAMFAHFTIKREKHYAPNWFNCLIACPFGQIQASITLISVGN